jgi:hypothetical protein
MPSPKIPLPQPELSTLEAQFLFILRALAPDLPAPVSQFVFAPPRRFRSDFCFLAERLLVECEGGVWSGGKHGRGSGVETDCEKMRHAAANHYRVFRVTRKSLDENPQEVVRLLRLALTPLIEVEVSQP